MRIQKPRMGFLIALLAVLPFTVVASYPLGPKASWNVPTGGELRFLNGSGVAASGLKWRNANSVSVTDGAGNESGNFYVGGSTQLAVMSCSSFQNSDAALQTTTVGAAGGASALPATPLGYLTIKRADSSTVKVPYYNP
jgi:hypothetical protein